MRGLGELWLDAREVILHSVEDWQERDGHKALNGVPLFAALIDGVPIQDTWNRYRLLDRLNLCLGKAEVLGFKGNVEGERRFRIAFRVLFDEFINAMVLYVSFRVANVNAPP